MAPIRILHVLGGLNMGGAESRIMDLYRHVDRSEVQFDFLVHYKRTDDDKKAGRISSEELEKVRPFQYFDEEVRSLGGKVYVLPRFNGTNILEYQKAVKAFFETHKGWAVVEGHMTSMAGVYLPEAKKTGAYTVAHARSAGVDAGIRGVATRIFRLGLDKKCDTMMACSRPAGLSVFGQKAYDSGKIMYVPNAVDLSAFTFNEDYRNEIRKEFGIADDEIVVGHVGRIDPVKNHDFLIDVFAALLKNVESGKAEHNAAGGKSYKLLLVGDGGLRDEITKKAESLGILDKVIFAGKCAPARTAKMYQAFDLFAFPSFYEGLPGTVVEAQSAGLICRIADTITDEVCITENVKQLPIKNKENEKENPAELWAKELLEADITGRKERSAEAMQKLDDAGYNVLTAAVKLQMWYKDKAK